MGTAARSEYEHQRKIDWWMYAILSVLLALGILYVLLFSQLNNDPSASSRNPISDAAITFIQRNLPTAATNPLFPPLALAAAFLLGGLHALTPGHNKTLTGSYLVGAHAHLRHVVLLGTATAFSHTASAIVIGALAVTTAGQIATTQYLQWVGLPSGLLTVALGIWLLRKHVGARGEHPHDHSHGHDHVHSHEQGHLHDHPIPDRVTLGGLVAMGLMHGIVPTFDAIAIILVALSVQQVWLGVGLILTYSLGIAGVLIAVGALFIRAQKVLLDSPRFMGFSNRASLLAAGLVVLFGLSLIVRTLLLVAVHD